MNFLSVEGVRGNVGSQNCVNHEWNSKIIVLSGWLQCDCFFKLQLFVEAFAFGCKLAWILKYIWMKFSIE